jgi:CheY-like chemotaxis protein
VEDEGIVAMDLRKSLTSMGYEVLYVFDSGEKTLTNLESSAAPDLILMDIELKGEKDGLETAKVIKEKYNIPIVFLTAFEDDATIEKITSLSLDGYIVKPFDDESLKSAVEKALIN